MTYCTYITIYRGSLLPPFYIGFTSVRKLNNGYGGTVTSKKYKTIWMSERMNHPELFDTRLISVHSSMQEAKARETELQLHLKVHTNPLYINQSIKGKFFCHNTPHDDKTKAKISRANKGRKMSSESRSKRSNRMSGNGNHMFNKRHTEKSLRQMSEVKVGIKKGPFSAMHKQRISEALKGRSFSEETLLKMSKANKDYIKQSFWWNNTTSEVRSKVAPGNDWVRGRLKR